jgi:hypothetical protein
MNDLDCHGMQRITYSVQDLPGGWSGAVLKRITVSPGNTDYILKLEEHTSLDDASRTFFVLHASDTFYARDDMGGWGTTISLGQTNPQISMLPINADGLFSLLISEANRASFIGDLEERFRIQVEEKGRRAASRWFWREVIHSFFSLAFDTLKSISGFERLIERYRRIGS